MPFARDCSCEGPVEAWLQNVVDAMRGAISAEFKAAMPAYAEKARTQWIFENSAQNTIVVSRAFFTQEVNEAFKELENGNEDALKVGAALALASAFCLIATETFVKELMAASTAPTRLQPLFSQARPSCRLAECAAMRLSPFMHDA